MLSVIVPGLGKHISVLSEGEARGRGGGVADGAGAEFLHVAVVATVETRDASQSDTVGAGDRRSSASSLYKSHSASLGACSWCGHCRDGSSGGALRLLIAAVHINGGLIVD